MIKKCIGCGITLQNTNRNNLGYTEDLNNSLCERCFKLKNYGEYQSVNLNNKEYQEIIASILKESLIVYITSLLNIDLEIINKFQNVLVVLTKKDLLPKSTKDYKLINYVKDHVNNYLDIEVVSAIKNYNLDSLMNKIKKYGNGKEIYFVGMTNSGKSTLINSLIKNYSDSSGEITTSIYPSTTLNKIYVKIGNLEIIDTPGLLSDSGLLNNLDLKEIKRITPKKEIKPRSYQLKENTSLLIDNIVRMDTTIKDNIVIYIANNLSVKKIGNNNNTFKDKYKYQINIDNNNDLIIEDLCFIKFQKKTSLCLYSPYKLNIYTRDNLI